MDTKLKILHLNTIVTSGGAARIAVGLHDELKKRGLYSQLATGGVIPPGTDFLPIEKHNYKHAQTLWGKLCLLTATKLSPCIGKIKGAGHLRNLCQNLSTPSNLVKKICGVEIFENASGTQALFNNLPQFPDIIHGHNLHGSYFDLRILPWLSKKAPVVLTLHDEWMYTGHCAYPLECLKWTTGCGKCPNLSIYQPLWRDTSAYNLKQKARIYQQSHLHIVTPSHWLMKRAEQSIIAPAIASTKVIYNGINLTQFKPGNKDKARNILHLPHNAYIILFVAQGCTKNPFKDYTTLQQAIFLLAEQDTLKKPLFLICIGEEKDTIQKTTAK
jgi:hypothetical protein